MKIRIKVTKISKFKILEVLIIFIKKTNKKNCKINLGNSNLKSQIKEIILIDIILL